MPGVAKFAMRAATLATIIAAPASHATDATDAAGGSRPIPIKLRIATSYHKLVYSIPVHFRGTALEAVLDTGSIPLLVLKGRVPQRDAQPTGGTSSVTYGSDRTYDSDVVQGRVRIGTTSGEIAFGVVTAAHCLPGHASCIIAGENAHDARFAGLHPAIVGARITTGSSSLQSAFRELGIHSFIITAPRDLTSDGVLRLDPSANEKSSFVPITNAASAADVPGGSVQGCLRDKTNGASFCGAVFLDTGTTGISVMPAKGSTQSTSWQAGDAGQLEFTGTGGAEIAGVDFAIDAKDPTQVSFAAPGQSTQAIIHIGQLPYIGLDILTDLDNDDYAVKARGARDGIAGHVP